MSRTSFWQKISLVIFGISLTIVLLETGLRIAGFVLLSTQERRNKISINKKGSYRIMCLGESTTARQYPLFLEEILNRNDIGVKFSVVDKGRDGKNTLAILFKLESDLKAYQPDMVITMMGINDKKEHMYYAVVSDSRALISLESFRVYKLAKLLRLCIINKFKGARLCKNELQKDIELGKIYLSRGRLFEADEVFKKALELNPKDYLAYIGIGKIYRSYGRFREAEEFFKKAVELVPKNDLAYIRIGEFYLSQGRFSEAEESFKKAVESDSKNDLACRALETIYNKNGEKELANEYSQRAKNLELNYYNPITAFNYHKLKTVLGKRNIVFVCVQYPMRNLEPLKKIFEGNDNGIIFVDNEKIFKNAVARDGYKDYFVDIFGGDFGHCTKKGNMLLAENISNVILKEVFNNKVK